MIGDSDTTLLKDLPETWNKHERENAKTNPFLRLAIIQNKREFRELVGFLKGLKLGKFRVSNRWIDAVELVAEYTESEAMKPQKKLRIEKSTIGEATS